MSASAFKKQLGAHFVDWWTHSGDIEHEGGVISPPTPIVTGNSNFKPQPATRYVFLHLIPGDPDQIEVGDAPASRVRGLMQLDMWALPGEGDLIFYSLRDRFDLWRLQAWQNVSGLHVYAVDDPRDLPTGPSGWATMTIRCAYTRIG